MGISFSYRAVTSQCMMDPFILVEAPSAASRFKPINPDLDGYWTDDERKETMGYNIVEGITGCTQGD